MKTITHTLKPVILVLAVAVILLSCTNSSGREDSPTPITKQIIKDTSKFDTQCWTDFIVGGPPMPNEFKGIDSLVKKYNICYHRYLNGCEVSDSILNVKSQFDKANQLYFKELETRFGDNWKKKFDKELEILNKQMMKY
jgi:hypothetical protein